MVSDTAVQLIMAHGFSPEALEANRAGILTPEQARSVKRSGNLAILVGFALGLFLLITGILGLKSPQFFADQVPQGSTGLVVYLSIGGGVLGHHMPGRSARRSFGYSGKRRRYQR